MVVSTQRTCCWQSSISTGWLNGQSVPDTHKGVPLRTKEHINVDRNCHLISFRSLSPLAVGQIGPWIKTDKSSFSSILKRKGLERKVTGNDNMFNKTRPQRQALLSHKRQQREREREREERERERERRERERERAWSRMVCVNPSPPLLRWPSPWSTPEPGQSEAITPAINSCSASLSMQIEGGRRLGKLFTAPLPHLAVVWRSAEPRILPWSLSVQCYP